MTTIFPKPSERHRTWCVTSGYSGARLQFAGIVMTCLLAPPPKTLTTLINTCCCRHVENKYGLPSGCIRAKRVNRYVRTGPTRGPSKRGVKPPALEQLVLKAAANYIMLYRLTHGISPDDNHIMTQLQEVYAEAGMPCKTRSYALQKLRKRFPDCFVSAKSPSDPKVADIVQLIRENQRFVEEFRKAGLQSQTFACEEKLVKWVGAAPCKFEENECSSREQKRQRLEPTPQGAKTTKHDALGLRALVNAAVSAIQRDSAQ